MMSRRLYEFRLRSHALLASADNIIGLKSKKYARLSAYCQNFTNVFEGVSCSIHSLLLLRLHHNLQEASMA